MNLSPFNPIPEDTRRAALNIYSPSQPYMIIGEQVDSLLTELDYSNLKVSWMESLDTLALLSLVTVFQYAERLSDDQAALATGQRIDWKYALHIPLTYPGIAPKTLCMFRRWLYTTPSSSPVIQGMLERCSAMGLTVDSPYGLPDTAEVIEVNCLKNCLDREINLLLPAMEVLASEHPEWLKQIALPHWFSRYMASQRSLFLAFSREELLETIYSLERDIDHLVKAIRSHLDWNVRVYPEVHSLMQSAKEDRIPFRISSGDSQPHGFQLDCSACSYPQYMHHFVKLFVQ
jgi:hypothetical protein